MGSPRATTRISGSTASTEALAREIARWQEVEGRRRLLERDASLWTGSGEAEKLGWLELPERALATGETVRERLASWRLDPIRAVVLLGMGGSSLGARALAELAGRDPQAPPLLVLDSTDPEMVRAIEERPDLGRALVFVASKSGGTFETRTLAHYFSSSLAPERFVAITDPGSELERVARDAGYAGVLLGAEDVGGRFSVLSVFGLAPAAAAGVPIERVARSAADAREHLLEAREPTAAERIGCALGVAARGGGLRLELSLPVAWSSLAAWLEQLLAESLGKEGRGLLPVIRHRQPGSGDSLEVRLPGPEGQGLEIRQSLDRDSLGALLFDWQVATAVAGWSLAVDPFDQPDVEAAKVETRRLVAELEQGAAWATRAGSGELLELGAPQQGTPSTLRDLLAPPPPGEEAYIALLAFLPERDGTVERLERVRRLVAARSGLACTVGFGPRYLHSTGQLHKGGPPCGRFLILTAECTEPVPLPQKPYGFAELEKAQALGDAAALARRRRPVVLAHLRRPEAGLDELERRLLDPDLLA